MRQSKKFEPIMVFTCGRTGSTLLIRILNCLAETIVWGEHGGALGPLLRSYVRLKQVAGKDFVKHASQFLPLVLAREGVSQQRGMTVEWLNWFGEQEIDDIFRETVANIFYPPRFHDTFSSWGFKEIQYRQPEYSALAQLFPRRRSILLLRHPAAVCRSQFQHFSKRDPKAFTERFGSIRSFYSFAAEQLGDSRSPPLFICHEDIATQFDAMIRLMESFLDEEFSRAGTTRLKGEIENFRKRPKPVGEPTADEVLADLSEWVTGIGITLPRAELGGLTADYIALMQRIRDIRSEPKAREMSYTGT